MSKQYKGWEIAKMISEGKLKAGDLLKTNYSDTLLKIVAHHLEREESIEVDLRKRELGSSFLASENMFFEIIQQPVSFMEAIEEASKDKKIKVVMNRSSFPKHFADALNKYMTINEMFKYIAEHLSYIGIRNVISEGKWYIEESEADSNDIR